jgi:hypothetical protein
MDGLTLEMYGGQQMVRNSCVYSNDPPFVAFLKKYGCIEQPGHLLRGSLGRAPIRSSPRRFRPVLEKGTGIAKLVYIPLVLKCVLSVQGM